MTRAHGVTKAPDTFLRGVNLAPLRIRGAKLAPPTNRHDTQMTGNDTHDFWDFSKNLAAGNQKAKVKKVVIRTYLLGLEDTWRAWMCKLFAMFPFLSQS